MGFMSVAYSYWGAGSAATVVVYSPLFVIRGTSEKLLAILGTSEQTITIRGVD